MKRPVFIVGCPRSGTTLLYSMLVAAGGFAAYRKETYFYDLLPRFPNLARQPAQRRFLDEFLQGYLGKVPGLDVAPLVRDAVRRCCRSADFLPLLMEAIAREQGVDRWIEGTPAHALCIKTIKHAIPNALVVQVIRDGRDCALSTDKQNWAPTLPWDRRRSIGVAALYWEWMVRRARAAGETCPNGYMEVRFEDLIKAPDATLRRVGAFIDHDLDYDVITRQPVHALKRPNTSFREERERADFNPVDRWETQCSAEQVELCEELVGQYLVDLGYVLSGPERLHTRPLRARLMRALYPQLFSARRALKVRTPFGRYLTRTTIWAEQPNPNEASVRAVELRAAGSPTSLSVRAERRTPPTAVASRPQARRVHVSLTV